MVQAVTNPSTRLDNAIAVKLDRMGYVEWSKELSDGKISSNPGAPFQLTDGSFLIAMVRFDITNGSETRILNISSVGDVLWESGPILNVGGVTYDVEADGVVVGVNKHLGQVVTTSGYEFPDYSPLLVKLDKQGKTLWSYQFDQSENVFNRFSGLWKDADGSYVVTGDLAVPDALVGPYFRARLLADRSQLTILSTTPLSSPSAGLWELNYSKSASDGGFYAGSTHMNGPSSAFQRISSSGKLVYRRMISEVCNCELANPAFYMPGNAVLVGGAVQALDGRDLFNEPTRSFVIVKAAADFGLATERFVYSWNPTDAGFGIGTFVPTADGGFALLGGTENGFMVIKTDPTGKASMTLPTETQIIFSGPAGRQ